MTPPKDPIPAEAPDDTEAPVSAATSGSATESIEDSAASAEAPEPGKRRRGRPKGSTARTTRTIELTLTVTGTADGEWEAELKQGSTWLSRGLPVSAAAVSRAAQELHAELAEPIDAVIDAAREQRAARVAALEAELEQARKALAEIGA
jgi:hypothetical protein